MAVDKFQADWIFLTLLAGPTYIKNEMNPFDPRRHGGGGGHDSASQYRNYVV